MEFHRGHLLSWNSVCLELTKHRPLKALKEVLSHRSKMEEYWSSDRLSHDQETLCWSGLLRHGRRAHQFHQFGEKNAQNLYKRMVSNPKYAWQIATTDLDWIVPGLSLWWRVWLDLLFYSASIANLAAISVDRYLKIVSPLTYDGRMTSSRVVLTLVALWGYSICLASLSLGPTGDAPGIVVQNQKCYNCSSTIEKRGQRDQLV